jgi:hypothetical protein
MSLEDLPQELQSRIVTTNAIDYMRAYDLNLGDFDLIPEYHSRIQSKFDHNTSSLYEDVAKDMSKNGIIAVCDVRISEVVVPEDDTNYRYMKSVIYGTGIKPRKKGESRVVKLPGRKDGS